MPKKKQETVPPGFVRVLARLTVERSDGEDERPNPVFAREYHLPVYPRVLDDIEFGFQVPRGPTNTYTRCRVERVIWRHREVSCTVEMEILPAEKLFKKTVATLTRNGWKRVKKT